jgi:DNA-directed RNA polymerase subunit RPC12/RpoP
MTCVKCGCENTNATGQDDDACPQCGALYAKARPTGARPVPNTRPAPLAATGTEDFKFKRTTQPAEMPRQFIDRLRHESLYPTFRAFAQFGFYFGAFIAVLVALGGAIAWAREKSFLTLVLAACAAVFVWLVAKALKEGSLMLADMSDAMVRMAEKAER